jgi:hypothetical protein
MLASLMVSAITFKRGTAEKIAFISLNVIDLVLTLLASNLGADEINPVMREMIRSPIGLYTAKIMIPLGLAWLLPGKLLIPSIAALVFIVGWDLCELTVFFL